MIVAYHGFENMSPLPQVEEKNITVLFKEKACHCNSLNILRTRLITDKCLLLILLKFSINDSIYTFFVYFWCEIPDLVWSAWLLSYSFSVSDGNVHALNVVLHWWSSEPQCRDRRQSIWVITYLRHYEKKSNRWFCYKGH